MSHWHALIVSSAATWAACSSAAPPPDVRITDLQSNSDNAKRDAPRDTARDSTLPPVDAFDDLPQDPTGTQWVTCAGGDGSDTLSDVATTASGDIYIAGYFEGSMNIGSFVITSKGDHDLFVARLDPGGAVLWAIAGGGADGLDSASQIAFDIVGNAVVVGTVRSSAATLGGEQVVCDSRECPVIATLTPSGKVVAFQILPDVEGSLSAVAIDGLGNRYLTGNFVGTAVFGEKTFPTNGGRDAFIAKTDSAGKTLWATSGGGAKDDGGYDVHPTPSGGVIATGWCVGAATFGSKLLTGATSSYLATLTSTGAFVSVIKVVPAGALGSLSLDTNGNPYVAGHFSGQATMGSTVIAAVGLSDAYLAKFDSTGVPQWAVSGGGSDHDGFFDLATSNSGITTAAGFFKAASTFGGTPLQSTGSNDVVVMQVDSTGATRWAHAAGGPGNDGAHAVALDPQASPIIGGAFEGTAKFGFQSCSSRGKTDIFIWKMAPPK